MAFFDGESDNPMNLGILVLYYVIGGDGKKKPTWIWR